MSTSYDIDDISLNNTYCFIISSEKYIQNWTNIENATNDW